jgi:cystine transport system permease protein
MQPYWPEFVTAMELTLAMLVVTVVLGIPAGFALAVLRLYQYRPINFLIVCYVDILRAVPPLMLIVLVYFALPFVGITVTSFWATVLPVAMVLAAFSEEVFWGAFSTTPPGQWEAARTTGLSYGQTIRSVIVPQSIGLSIPPLTNRAIAAGKTTALASVVAAPDLLGVANSLQATLANPTALTVGAGLYLVIFLPFVVASRLLERRFGRKKV